uniref:Uncharacterized protein n=1 Tax=Timema poppense TaxID=170557 RepID=A0A7R9GVB7_TIMPO|nr:unnamed protein product [Timema poppensis]
MVGVSSKKLFLSRHMCVVAPLSTHHTSSLLVNFAQRALTEDDVNVTISSATAWILGYLCALEALLLSIITRFHSVQYTPVDEDPSQMTLQEQRRDNNRSPSPSLQLQLKPVVPVASTSAPVWPVDDVQPCSSKCPDPYTVP